MLIYHDQKNDFIENYIIKYNQNDKIRDVLVKYEENKRHFGEIEDDSYPDNFFTPFLKIDDENTIFIKNIK